MAIQQRNRKPRASFGRKPRVSRGRPLSGKYQFGTQGGFKGGIGMPPPLRDPRMGRGVRRFRGAGGLNEASLNQPQKPQLAQAGSPRYSKTKYQTAGKFGTRGKTGYSPYNPLKSRRRMSR